MNDQSEINQLFPKKTEEKRRERERERVYDGKYRVMDRGVFIEWPGAFKSKHSIQFK